MWVWTRLRGLVGGEVDFVGGQQVLPVEDVATTLQMILPAMNGTAKASAEEVLQVAFFYAE